VIGSKVFSWLMPDTAAHAAMFPEVSRTLCNLHRTCSLKPPAFVLIDRQNLFGFATASSAVEISNVVTMSPVVDAHG
jgi:hypothetical protein